MTEKTKEIDVVTTEECHAIWDIPETLIRNKLYHKNIVLPDDIVNYKTFRDTLTMIAGKRCPTLQNLIVKDMDDAIKDAVKKGQLELDYLHDWNNCCPKCNSSNVDEYFDFENEGAFVVDDPNSNISFWKCDTCRYQFRTCSVHILVVD